MADFLGQLKSFAVEDIRNLLTGAAGLAATRRDAIQWCGGGREQRVRAALCCACACCASRWHKATPACCAPHRCLTVPAMWTDAAKQRMRGAALAAGLIPTETSDALSIILEPEAAVLHALEAKAPPLLPGE